MGSGNMPEPYFFAKKQNSAISVSIIGIEQFYYNFYYKRGKTYREREGNARKDHTSKDAKHVHM